MERRIAARALWFGRVTSALVGLVIVGLAALGVSATALAAVPGDPFKLGRLNAIDRLTSLTGTSSTALLKIDNNGTGPALNLQVESGNPPLTVNATAGKATNLNADKLDGLDASAFLPAHVYSLTKTVDAPAEQETTASIECNAGDVAISGGFLGVDGGRVGTSMRGIDNALAWTVTVDSTSPDDDSFTIGVVCIDL